MRIGALSVGALSSGDLSIGNLKIVVTLLAAATVLAWPGVGPGGGSVGVAASGSVRTRAGHAHAGAGAGVGAGAGSGERARAVTGVIRSVVPVADVAGVIDLLALTLQGGVGLVEAMEAVATRVGGTLGLHLRTVAAAGRWGVEDATAWASVPAAWQPAARALRMAASAGVPPADALAGAADEVRRAEQQRLEVATARLGVRIVLPLGLVFLPAFILTTVVPIVLALAQQVLASQ
jgi:Type II secretion system (T2SS), protein F